jgi:hypothetical protein
MSSLKTIQSIHNDRRSPNQRDLPNPTSNIPGIPNCRSPIFGHSNRPTWRSISADIGQTPIRISIDSVAPIHHKQNNIKTKSLRLSVSASKSPSPSSRSNHEIPNDPNPTSGHSTTPPAPPPRLLPSISTPSPPPLSPLPNCTYPRKSSILGRFGSFRVRCLKSWSSATGRTPLKAV